MCYSVIVGIDNGVSGNIGIICPNSTLWVNTPTNFVRKYTKKHANVTRVDYQKLVQTLVGGTSTVHSNDVLALVERPMINGRRFNASISAARCHEATLVALETVGFKYEFVGARDWQKMLIPEVKDRDLIKAASRNFGEMAGIEQPSPDYDGLMIAYYGLIKLAQEGKLCPGSGYLIHNLLSSSSVPASGITIPQIQL